MSTVTKCNESTVEDRIGDTEKSPILVATPVQCLPLDVGMCDESGWMVVAPDMTTFAYKSLRAPTERSLVEYSGLSADETWLEQHFCDTAGTDATVLSGTCRCVTTCEGDLERNLR